jgi:aminoglycoside phosphotransferase (APT) family kinase protein
LNPPVWVWVKHFDGDVQSIVTSVEGELDVVFAETPYDPKAAKETRAALGTVMTAVRDTDAHPELEPEVDGEPERDDFESEDDWRRAVDAYNGESEPGDHENNVVGEEEIKPWDDPLQQ